MSAGRRIAVGTIASHPFAPAARVLAASFLERHPDVPFFFLLADGGSVPGDSVVAQDRLVALGDLDLGPRRLPGFLFRHTPAQAAIALKPWFLSHLLDRGFESALFLDADSVVLDDLDDLLAAASHAAITLVPHRLRPADTDSELAFLRAGTFNGGVIGVSDRPDGRRFLEWWRERVAADCRISFEEGLFDDQRWLDLAPAYSADLHVLRDPGVNVAYWNLDERWQAGAPLRHFHFSGFDPLHPRLLSRHAPAVRVDRALARLLRAQSRRLLAAGWREAAGRPYFYDRFDDGTAIPPIARRLYALLPEADFDDPFASAGPRSFRQWLDQPAADGADGVTHLWHAIWRQRLDLQGAFPEPLGPDREAFLRWTREHGRREYSLRSE